MQNPHETYVSNFGIYYLPTKCWLVYLAAHHFVSSKQTEFTMIAHTSQSHVNIHIKWLLNLVFTLCDLALTATRNLLTQSP